MSSRGIRTLILPLFVAAITGAAFTLMGARDPAPPTVTGADTGQQTVPADEREAITRLAQDYAFAWSTHDVDGLVGLYDPNAFVLSSSEGGARGKQALQSFFTRQVGAPEQNTRVTVDVQNLEPLGPGLALVDVVRRSTQVASTEELAPMTPGSPNPPPGVPRTKDNRPVDVQVVRGTWVVAQSGDGWKIQSERLYPDPHACAMLGVGGAGPATGPSPAAEPLNPAWNAPLEPPAQTPSRTWPQIPAGPNDPGRSPWQTPGGY